MSLDDLYQAQQEGNKTLLEDLFQQNEVVINYFETISNPLQDLLKSESPDAKKINSNVNNLQNHLPTLSKIKFLIFEMEDDIPASLSEKWNKKVKYIKKMMSINECDNFLQELKEFEIDVESEKQKEQIAKEQSIKEKERLVKEGEIKKQEEIERLKAEEERKVELKREAELIYQNIIDHSRKYLKELKTLNAEIESISATNYLHEQNATLKKIVNNLIQLKLHKIFSVLKDLILKLEHGTILFSHILYYNTADAARCKLLDDCKKLHDILLNLGVKELLLYKEEDDRNEINVLLYKSYKIYGEDKTDRQKYAYRLTRMISISEFVDNSCEIGIKNLFSEKTQ